LREGKKYRLISSKISLHADVYNHQKVLATNMLVSNILYLLNDHNNTIQGISLENRIDFLSFTDWSFLTGDTHSEDIKKLQEMIARRDIPVRYVRIFKQSINCEKSSDDEEDNVPPRIVPYFGGDDNERLELTRLLCEKCGFGFFKPKGISMGFSKPLKLGELQNAYIKNYDGSTVLYEKIMPTNLYTNQYGNKWAVYVFGPYERITDEVYSKASNFLQDKLGIVLNDNAKPNKILRSRTKQ